MGDEAIGSDHHTREAVKHVQDAGALRAVIAGPGK